MKRLTRLLAILLALALVLTLSVSAFADFGDFSDGGDYDSGSDNDYDSDYDSDYSSGSSRRGDTNYVEVTIGIVIIVLVIYLSRRGAKKGGTIAPRQSGPHPAAGNYARDGELMPVEAYLSADPNFNPAETREWASNLYVRMQNGWTKGDISDLRPYFTPAYFSQMEAQLRAKTEQGLINVMERVSVREAEIKGFYRDADEDHMILYLGARVVDYTVEIATGRIVAGSRDQEIFLRYRWDLSRTAGVVTARQTRDESAHCPNCGAPLDLNTSARCEYCGSVVEAARHDWAICNITKL